MRNIKLITAVLLLFLFSASQLWAQMGHNADGRGGKSAREGKDSGGQGLKPFTDMGTAVPDFLLIDLNLTKEQVGQIVHLRDVHMKNIKQLQEEAFNKREELHRLWSEKAAEQEKISAMQKEIISLRDQMRDKIAQYLQDVRKILTPEQRSMLRNYWNAWDGGYIVHGN
jgi:Spy/CpxP family protein refolding chaperone